MHTRSTTVFATSAVVISIPARMANAKHAPDIEAVHRAAVPDV